MEFLKIHEGKVKVSSFTELLIFSGLLAYLFRELEAPGISRELLRALVLLAFQPSAFQAFQPIPVYVG